MRQAQDGFLISVSCSSSSARLFLTSYPSHRPVSQVCGRQGRLHACVCHHVFAEFR